MILSSMAMGVSLGRKAVSAATVIDKIVAMKIYFEYGLK